MKNLFEAARVKEVKERIAQLRPDSQRLWGTMNPAQALAHCSAGIQMGLGDIKPPRKMIGRIIRWAIKPMALRNDEPMRRNSPTVKDLVVQDDRDLVAEKERLGGLDRPVCQGRAENVHNAPAQLLWAVDGAGVGDTDVQASGSSSEAVWGVSSDRAKSRTEV
jgi:hypothetical protein